jgi:hypothetical protein
MLKSMPPLFTIVAIIVAALTALYVLRMSRVGAMLPGFASEMFRDYIGTGVASARTPDGVVPDLAAIRQGVLLEDTLAYNPGLTAYTAADVANIDDARQMELGGQYVQRTNNYRREYPDNSSAPLSEFVGAVYAPKNGVGRVVPCGGQC